MRELALEERRNEEALSDEPPMAVLENAHLVDLGCLHRARAHT
jgi:hypothetical protein